MLSLLLMLSSGFGGGVKTRAVNPKFQRVTRLGTAPLTQRYSVLGVARSTPVLVGDALAGLGSEALVCCG